MNIQTEWSSNIADLYLGGLFLMRTNRGWVVAEMVARDGDGAVFENNGDRFRLCYADIYELLEFNPS